jgi:tripartite-type tricarboxylate transporter receptor subunit TctC
MLPGTAWTIPDIPANVYGSCGAGTIARGGSIHLESAARGGTREVAMKPIRAVLAAAVALSVSVPAMADDWPSRPVRIISTFAAGGAADVLARVIAEHLSTAFKQQFFVEVRAGAGGQIAVRSVIEAPPDGYNFVLVSVSHLVLHPMTRADATYDPIKDLTNIAFAAGSPVVLTVNSEKSGIKTFKDFLDRGRAQTLTYSSSGLGTMGHLVGENFVSMSKIKSDHVPYKGASQALNDLAGGHIIWCSQTLSSSSGLLRNKTINGLAVSTSARLPDWPDIPTFKEQGFPDLVASIWFALSGPANLPPAMVKKLNEEIRRGMAKPEVAARLRRDGMVSQDLTPDQFRQFIIDEKKVWGPVVQQVGLAVKK